MKSFRTIAAEGQIEADARAAEQWEGVRSVARRVLTRPASRHAGRRDLGSAFAAAASGSLPRPARARDPIARSWDRALREVVSETTAAPGDARAIARSWDVALASVVVPVDEERRS